MQNDDCIFCKIVAGEMPSHKIWEDENHLAFLSIFPNTEGVTVVIPKAHHPSYIFENDETVIAKIMNAAKKVAQKIDAHFDDVGRTGVIFEGFGVDHLHAKLYPMHGTGNLTEWQPIESEEKNTYYEQYPGYLVSNDSNRANDAKLADLAQKMSKPN
jgi:diadenosine tetraphosphate (Ap4A) HIT family hydrolase